MLNNLPELRRRLSKVGKLKKSVESVKSSVAQLRRLRVKCGVQLSVIWKKLNVVADRGRRKLSMVTDGAQLGVVTENLTVVTEVRKCDSRDIYIYTS